MSEDPKERVNRIRAKINQLSKINPNTYLSDRQLDKINQKLQEKRKGIIPFTELDHHKGIFERNPLKPSISFIKKAQDTETIVTNYFKKIELKKQQSANNQSLKKQKENQIKGIKLVVGNEIKSNNVQKAQQNLAKDLKLKQIQVIPVQKPNFNNKQACNLLDNSKSSSPQINNIPTLFQTKEKAIESIVVIDSPRRDKPSTQKINIFISKKQEQKKPYQNQKQFIDIDKQIPKKRTNIFTQDLTIHPPKNPFQIGQQKKMEIQFEKPKIKQNEQNIYLQQYTDKTKRFESIQPRFQPIKRMFSQPVPTSNMSTNRINSTESIFAKSVNGLNLQPASKNQQNAQNTKKSNQTRQIPSLRQQNNIFIKKDSFIKNEGAQKPLSSISESISEQNTAKSDSALKIPRQKNIPLFQDRSSKKPPQQDQRIQKNHQVQFQNFGPSKSNQIQQIDSSQDGVQQIPKNQYQQPSKVNIFISNIRKDNDQSGTINLFKNASSNNPEQKKDTNNTSSSPAPVPNIFGILTNKSKNIFSQPNPETKTEPKQNIFAKMTTSDNIFGQSNFQKNAEEKEQIDDNDSENSNQPIEDKDNADPSLSTVKYDYEKPDLIFKEPSNRFRCGLGQNSLIENLMISLEKSSNSEGAYLIARMANKLVSFNGKLLKNITKIRILNNNSRNVEITKILSMATNKANELVLLRIQFKDNNVGDRFISQVQKIIN